MPKGRINKMRYESVKKELRAMDNIARILIPLTQQQRQAVLAQALKEHQK